MKTKRLITTALLAGSTLLAMGSAQAALIQQTVESFQSGTTNYGQRFAVESTFFPANQSLDSITFYYGGDFTTRYLDIYEIGTANIATLNFSNATETANLLYLGSSTNTVAASSLATSTPLIWNFSGITLKRDTPYFAVFSGNNVSGGFISNRLRGTGSESFVNVSDANTGALFNGVISPNEDNKYSISVTAVPEPGSLALVALGGLLVARRRRMA